MPSRAVEYALYSAKVGLLAATYVATARLGLTLDPVSGFATFVWPPTGLALAALLLFGRDLWPGVALGALAANLWNGATIPVAAGIALGNTLEAALGAYALYRVPQFRITLDRLADALALIGLAAVASTVVSATIGVTSLYAGGVMPGSRFAETWLAWWQGDLIGNLIVAPFILSWATGLRGSVPLRRVAEATALGVALLGASVLLLGGNPAAPTGLSAFRQPTTLLPLLIWAALRFGTMGATGATLLVSGVAVWSTAAGRGPFIRPELHQSLAVSQAFMAVVAVTFLVLGAVTAERRRADRERTELYHRERLARAYAEEMKQRRQA
jgi:two-component system, NarL family, sensor histidine kinase FusK